MNIDTNECNKYSNIEKVHLNYLLNKFYSLIHIYSTCTPVTLWFFSFFALTKAISLKVLLSQSLCYLLSICLIVGP